MSLFSIEKSPEELVKDRLSVINNASIQALDNFIQGFEQTFCSFWQDEDPQALLDVQGHNAYKMFMLSQKTIEFIMLFKPDYQLPAVARDFTINEDGTVTLK